ncbi:UvrD-helicase domain-containing protein [Arenimonas fontis]|uniref:RecBCD enzyme subunit RecB n=1 Tax=Arenimonas fontis TaxID=2608255 RepID=A0A5B2Z657_9GAMM|nr:UvrD-helicase domain-containing protein [Arenimonas fontis]KAA2284318.1 AAA family ATPase [Arenimonas fontis]
MSAVGQVASWRELELGPGGRSLVEASAGTGKTWTIGVLWLRLLLERGEELGVERIVVTTFTEAAAQELRERLRRRLREALDLAAGAVPEAPDEGEAWLLSRWQDEACRARDLRRLRLALADFDRAPIGTLHGLCQRILSEHPLESGQAFEPGEPASGKALLEELARDAWRVLRQGDDTPLHEAGLQDIGLEEFTRVLGELLRPGVRIVAPEETLEEVRLALAPSLAGPLREVVAQLEWFTRKNAVLRTSLEELGQWLETGVWPNDSKKPTQEKMDERFKLLTAFELEKQVKDDRQADFLALPAIASLRAAWPRFLASRHGAALRFWAQQVQRVGEWREARLAARGQLTFDEMIRRAHAAISANPALADVLFADWPAALVDEFQDTDAQQYGILDRIYRDGGGLPRGRLVMIGDPKQAIYGFRGGDVHAYLRASRDAGEHLPLATNHRSSRAYVAALNALFAAAGNELSTTGRGGIAYHPVAASDRQDKTPYLIGGQPAQAPLVLHLLEEAPPSQPERRQRALKACANHIAALLADPAHTLVRKRGKEHLPERVAPGDIAVLLPGNADIVRLRRELLALGVPCVGGARASVLDSDWAFELQVLLQAIAAEADETALRAAMLTRLWGGDLAAVQALEQDAAALDAAADRLHRLRQLWRRQGVLAAVLAMAGEAAPRLLAHPGGERDLTDLRHLGELLQAQSERGLGPHALLAWLGEQRSEADSEAPDSEQRQLRIESDAHRVQLMTLHGAKGLEFPIVFLPLLWNHQHKGGGKGPWLVPDPDVPGRVARLDAGAADWHRQEAQDERFRTLYVALTRAIHACHVYALPPDRPAKKGSQAALGDPERAPLDALLERLGLPGRRPLIEGVQWREGWPEEGVAPLSLPTASPRREALEPPPPAPPRHRLSFSALIGGAHARALDEAAADDEQEAPLLEPVEAEPEPAHPELLALSALRGTAFGNAVHASFELRDHGKPLRGQLELVGRQLARFGVRSSSEPVNVLVPRLAARLDAALQAELLPGLCLAEVPPEKQRAEMAFHFALDGARLDALRRACAEHGEPTLVPPLGLAALRGLMTGKVDLIFEHAGCVHVLDYKGNWLGERLSDYRGEALRQAMDRSHYRLQALLYTLALHRYLRQRLAGYAPERHLGEAIYLFVRAAGLAPGAGVWSRRFDPALLAAVDGVFAGRGEMAA